MHPGLVGEELDLPDEVYGFGSWLLWLLATRATDTVDRAFAAGPARPSRHYGTVDGHPVPTPSLVAWLLTAAECGVSLEQLAKRDHKVDERHKVLRTIVSRAVGGEPRLFKDTWLRQLAAVCGLDDPELDMLARCRDDEGYPVDPHMLRKAIARTFRARPPGSLGKQVDSAASGSAQAIALVAREQLPPLVTGFTARDVELAIITGLLDPAAAAEAVIVSAAGLAGVGKTALAVQAAHTARERGWFSGGVLFIDLHGYDEAAVEPSQALDAMLRALGVPAEHIPFGPEARAGMYRSALARSSQPVLVIADNASSEAQVRFLLPGPGPHRVIVTSRHTLAGLGARLLDVMVLDEHVAVTLLETALHAARPDDVRVANEPAAAARLARICGGLPLALQIAAALLKADPFRSMADLTEELAVEHSRLETLRYDDGSGVSSPSVAAAFELSYRRLDDAATRIFRVLPVNPGPDVSTAAAAILADLPEHEVRKALRRLASAHLVDTVAGRWRMHDLVRLYAQQLSDAHAETDGRKQARERLLGYYVATADAADDRLRAAPGTAEPARFTSRDEALEWLDTERPNLIAAVTTAADTGCDEVAIRLAFILTIYLRWRWRLDENMAIHDISLKSARRMGNRLAEAMALGNLGVDLQETRQFDEAIAAGLDTLAIFREIGDRHREGMALNNLGLVLPEVGRFDEAIAACQEALVIHREVSDRPGEADALETMCAALRQAGRLDEAIAAAHEAATIYQEISDPHRGAMALNSLGLALQEAARLDEAIAAYRDAAATFQRTGDLHRQGDTLANLGLALEKAARLEEAITAYQAAVGIFRQTGDRYRENMALGNLERLKF